MQDDSSTTRTNHWCIKRELYIPLFLGSRRTRGSEVWKSSATGTGGETEAGIQINHLATRFHFPPSSRVEETLLEYFRRAVNFIEKTTPRPAALSSSPGFFSRILLAPFFSLALTSPCPRSCRVFFSGDFFFHSSLRALNIFSVEKRPLPTR